MATNKEKEYFQTINRNAIVLTPAEAFFEWLNQFTDDEESMTYKTPDTEGTVYLMPEIDGSPDKWLKKNFKDIFYRELMAWYTDESFMPEDMSFKAFNEFFHVRFCSMVFDTGKRMTMRDEM